MGETQFFTHNPLIGVFLYLKIMDENEILDYINQMERLRTADLGETKLLERVRDEDGIFSPGCYHVLPAPVEE